MNAEVKPIEFEILGQRYEATPRKTSSGSRLWQYTNSEESSGGAEIEPLADTLPEVLTVNDEEFKFGPVPRRGGATGTRSLETRPETLDPVPKQQRRKQEQRHPENPQKVAIESAGQHARAAPNQHRDQHL